VSAGLFLALALVVAQAAPAAKPPPGPTLSDVQRLTILTTMQRAEIAQLRAQAAQRDLEALLKSLELQGYTLDLQTLTYTPVKAPAK
jgi:hypothetical protein